jgi:hypothetical protein
MFHKKRKDKMRLKMRRRERVKGMYDEIYVMETLNKLKQTKFESARQPQLPQNRKNQLVCKLPIIKNFEVCQCQS